MLVEDRTRCGRLLISISVILGSDADKTKIKRAVWFRAFATTLISEVQRVLAPKGRMIQQETQGARFMALNVPSISVTVLSEMLVHV